MKTEMSVDVEGHAGPVLCFLAMKEYFDLEHYDAEPPHLREPLRMTKNGVDMTTGSLGGLSLRWNGTLQGWQNAFQCILRHRDARVRRKIWEASMFASQMKLGNLIVFLDHNNLQIDGSVEDINSLSSPSERWRAFGWNTQEIDGHDLQAINEAVERAKRCQDRPNLIVAKTIKGKGWKKSRGRVKSTDACYQKTYRGLVDSIKRLKENSDVRHYRDAPNLLRRLDCPR